MAAPVFKVQIAEGGTGVVHEDDPAYSICKALRKAGYNNIVLPLATFASGVPGSDFLHEDGHLLFETSEDQQLLNVESYLDQKQYLGGVETQCVHHWIIQEPVPGEPDQGICKWCGEEKVFAKPDLDIRQEMDTLPFRRLLKKNPIYLDWKARMHEALVQANAPNPSYAARADIYADGADAYEEAA